MGNDFTILWKYLLEDVHDAKKLKRGKEILKIANELAKDLRPKFPGKSIRVYAFGSRTMGLGDSHSDLDLYVEVGNCREAYSDKPNKNVFRLQTIIAGAIKRNPRNWIFLETPRGRCPLVVVQHRSTRIECDISFSHGMAHCQNKLVTYIFELQPIVRYMVIYLRGWTTYHGLSNVRSHLLVLMVIFLFQVNGDLPSICDFQDGLTADFGPWITKYNLLKLKTFRMKQIQVTKAMTTRKLAEFFKYYSTFDYYHLVICPYLGYEIGRHELLSHMHPRVQKYWESGSGFSLAPLAIQDLMHLNHNKGSLIKNPELLSFQMRCLGMHGIINQKPNPITMAVSPEGKIIRTIKGITVEPHFLELCS